MPPPSSPPKAQVQRSDTQMIDERGVVGTRAQRADAQVGTLARPRPAPRPARARCAQLIALPHRNLLFRIFDVARHAIDEFLERVRAGHAQEPAAVAVGVDVHGRMRAQLRIVLFGPFGGTQQPFFLAVPHAIDDGALRFPALLQQFGESAGFFHQSHRARNGIFGAVHPGIVMVAANDPLVGISARRECGRSRRRSVFVSQLNSSFRCTRAGPGPTR